MNPLNLPAALMSRLTYARKFALLGLVLLAPAAFALHAYWTTQGDTLAFADSERVGVRYLGPANDLLLRVVAARGVAIRGDRPHQDATGVASARSLERVGRERTRSVHRPRDLASSRINLRSSRAVWVRPGFRPAGGGGAVRTRRLPAHRRGE